MGWWHLLHANGNDLKFEGESLLDVENVEKALPI